MKKFLTLLIAATFMTTLPASAQAAEALLKPKKSLPIPLAVMLPEGKHWGYWNAVDQDWQIAPQYREAHSFTASPDFLAWVQLENRGYTLINPSGTQLTAPMPFEDVAPPSEGLARFKLDSKWGYLSIQDGTFAIPPTFLQAREFSGGLAAIENRPGRWTYINPQGKKAVLRDFSFAYSFIGDRAIALEERGFYGLISRTGEWMLTPRFGAIYAPLQGEKNYLVGKVDKGKKQFIPYYEVVNNTAFAINSFKAEDAKPYKFFGAPVKQNGKWGYIDLETQWLIPAEFEDAQAFINPTLGAVKKDGLWGLITPTFVYSSKNSSVVKAGGRWVQMKPGDFVADGYEWLLKPTWEQEPDLSLLEHSGQVITVNQLFYNLDGEKIDNYANAMTEGEQALRQGNKATAKALFEQALAKIPDDKAALYGIERASN